MNKRLLLAVVLLFTVVFMTGCFPKKQPANGGDKLKVYTSFYPMYDFAKKVGGEKIELTNLTSSGGEVHDWEPSANDIIKLEGADVFIYNGAGMEHWVKKVLKSLSNKELVVVEASKGIAFLDSEQEDGHSEEEGTDPHVWLSIKNAKLQMENIKNAFVSADPQNAAYYERNYTKYASLFDALDKEYGESLAALPGKNIVVSHKSFAYLCHEYGLNQIGIEGVSADSEPEPRKMAEVIRFVKENNVKYILFQSLVSPKTADTIARETGASTAVLSSVERLTDEQLASGADYLSIMRENLETLKKALE
ncbi:MAG: High-affinity zinc uptake system binding-protein ZnuA precursor [Firmicutes bacterium ADurb.Bin193]|nr:MAG: High-affinity zinc uptake system binding-protein ZnuA precursor [Firmicutes bacterium ADurb.Bin193]